ncbi:MAG TPA: response regulator, partial [Desulfatirhabdiaceae bacterium]|nr:response regulator [Desulfatirhabdiaceae bacterium]
MSVISVFNGLFCNEESVIQGVVAKTGFRLIQDRDVIASAGKLSGIPDDRIARTFSSKASIFNPFTHEKERSLAYLKLAMAEILAQEKLLLAGFSCHLIPVSITHVLRVCLIADVPFRLNQAGASHTSEKDALKLIRKSDEDRSVWTSTLRQETDPWEPGMYDMVIPMGKISGNGAIDLIVANIHKDVLSPTLASRESVKDFLLQAQVEVALACEGHDVDVSSRDGAVMLTINKHVLMLSRLEQELKTFVSGLPDVKSVKTRVGSDFHQADIYRKFDFQTPSKVLLVDDEREFVQTLSERLTMRDMGSAVAYDGESALKMAREEEPEVMILDLKMPGLDGIEVLRRIKDTKPEIEVIILTGHG